MKRFLLTISLLALLLASCSDVGIIADTEGENDYPTEIANDISDSDGQIVNKTKTQEDQIAVDDVDGDLISDEKDNCPTISNPYQEDTDDNGIGDACNFLN